MIRFYIQQAIFHLRENPVVSWISVLGTALSICMIMVIVITLRVRTDVSGQHVELNHVDFQVCGVVADVSMLATDAYAQVWIPYTAGNAEANSWGYNLMGLALSYAATFVLNGFLFGNSTNAYLAGETSLTAGALLSPWIFLAAFLFCLLMNLLSAGIPAWRASRMNIVEAINGKR